MPLPTSGDASQIFTSTVDGQTVTGTIGNDRIIGFGKPASGTGTMIGGRGDDTYIVHSEKHRVVEKAGEGIDTVLADWGYTLGTNVENLILTGTGANTATGNELNNIIIGNINSNVINGKAGNDELTGGGGRDMFYVTGRDTILDFTVNDRLNLQAFTGIQNFAQLKSAMTMVGSDTVITLSDTDSVTLKNFNGVSLTADSVTLANQVSSYKQVFGDEFNSFKLNLGTGSTENWYPLFPRTGLAGHTTVDHGSVQYFTYPEDTGTYGQPVGINPFSLNDGVLTISMNPVPEEDQTKIYGYEYSSGNINSIASFHQTYGYFEIRAKLAAGQGVHDAFWMLPMDGSWPPELDIVEQRGADPTRTIYGAHYNGGSASGTASVPTATTEFHTYGMDWEPDFLTWYIDGVAVRSIPTPPGLDKPMYMLANLGGGSDWAGDPDTTTPWPAQMQIDYIRAYASANTLEKGVAFNTIGTAGSDTLYGTSLGDTLNGGLGDDFLYGGAGNDMLTGGGGKDLLDGGFGDDLYLVTSATDDVREGGTKGVDIISTTLSRYILPANTENLIYTGAGNFIGGGNNEDNVIRGGNGFNTLTGSDGNDTLYGGIVVDNLSGGDSNDRLFGNAGNDVLRGNAGDDLLYGEDGADLIKGDDGNDVLDGGAGDDNLQGLAGNDQLIGGVGNDNLDGGIGIDIMIGGTGDDSYIVDDAQDVVVERLAEGTDTVRTLLATYALGANIENLTFTGPGPFTGTGNDIANRIIGGANADTLDGGKGSDTLTVGSGDDTVIMHAGEAAGDRVLDFSGAGVDGGDQLRFIGYGPNATISKVGDTDFYTITGNGFSDTMELDGVKNLSSADYVFVVPPPSVTVTTADAKYTLPAATLNVTYIGNAMFTGTGNTLANIITGGIMNDRLDGGAAADTLVGGFGNDTYVIDNVNDRVIELAGQGNDRVLTKVGYTLDDNVEGLQLTTSKALDGTGNALANTLIGNSAINHLNGAAGADRLTGGGGNDVFHFERTEANGDKVTDYTGAGALGGDLLQFTGFGEGAYLTQVGTSDMYLIHAGPAYAGAIEAIQLIGVTHLTADDYLFL
jgi:Ca2+-binding RTX toxin-like protein